MIVWSEKQESRVLTGLFKSDELWLRYITWRQTQLCIGQMYSVDGLFRSISIFISFSSNSFLFLVKITIYWHKNVNNYKMLLCSFLHMVRTGLGMSTVHGNHSCLEHWSPRGPHNIWHENTCICRGPGCSWCRLMLWRPTAQCYHQL